MCGCDGRFFLLSSSFLQRAVLLEGVTDSGVRALVSAGCGERLTEVSFERAFVLLSLFPMAVMAITQLPSGGDK